MWLPHCNFYLHFSNIKQCWAFFHVFTSHLYVFFGEMSIQVFSPFFDWWKKKRKKSRTNCRMNQNVRMIVNVFPRSQLSASFAPLRATAHVHLATRPSSSVVGTSLWASCGDSSDSNLPYPCIFLLPMSTPARARAFSFGGNPLSFYIFHRLKST